MKNEKKIILSVQSVLSVISVQSVQSVRKEYLADTSDSWTDTFQGGEKMFTDRSDNKEFINFRNIDEIREMLEKLTEQKPSFNDQLRDEIRAAVESAKSQRQ